MSSINKFIKYITNINEPRIIAFGGTYSLLKSDFYKGKDLIIYTKEGVFYESIIDIINNYFIYNIRAGWRVENVRPYAIISTDNDTLLIRIVEGLPEVFPKYTNRTILCQQIKTIENIINECTHSITLSTTMSERAMITYALNNDFYKIGTTKGDVILKAVRDDTMKTLSPINESNDTVKDKFIDKLLNDLKEITPIIYGGTYNHKYYKGDTLIIAFKDNYGEVASTINELLRKTLNISHYRIEQDMWSICFNSTNEYLHIILDTVNDLQSVDTAEDSQHMSNEEVVSIILYQLTEYRGQLTKDELLYLIWVMNNLKLDLTKLRSLLSFTTLYNNMFSDYFKFQLSQLGEYAPTGKEVENTYEALSYIV